MAKQKKQAPKKAVKKNAKVAKKVQQPKVQQPKVVQPAAKTKPIAKAKKYKAKTAEQMARINRSKTQRIYLINATRNADSWSFTVQGTSGTNYYVTTSTNVSCTCMDYRLRKTVCKHIYFIVTQVGQNDEILDYFKSGDRKISKNAYKILDSQLSQRLKARLEKPKENKVIDLKDDPTCIICFMDMEKETENLEDCGTCKRYFHTQCIAAWKGHNPNCPLCRGNLTGGLAGGGVGALGKLANLKL